MAPLGVSGLPALPLLLAVVLSGKAAMAHEHHADAIPEGQTVSDDPIVGALLGSAALGCRHPLTPYRTRYSGSISSSRCLRTESSSPLEWFWGYVYAVCRPCC